MMDAVVYKRRKENYKYKGRFHEQRGRRKERGREGGKDGVREEMESLFNVNQLSDTSGPEAKE